MIIVSGGLLSKEAVPLIIPLMISNRTKVFTINSLRTESDFLRVFVNNLVNLRFYMTTLDLNFGSGDLCTKSLTIENSANTELYLKIQDNLWR